MPTSFSPPGVLHEPVTHRRAFSVLGLAALLTTVFVVGHLPFISGTMDGIDSANFILAVDRYDPGSHQPHPPGFPVHVALGRVVNSAFQALAPAGPEGEFGSVGARLRMWSVICGALAIFSLIWIATGLGASAWRGALVAALAATCPLFWITAMRPLSDVPGLFFAILSQALALAASNAANKDDAGSRIGVEWRLLPAAAIAGLAVGVRVQTALLTMPLLALVTVGIARRSGPAVIARVSVAVLSGVLVWAVPMIGAVGGPAEYVRLLTTVASVDLEGVELLATHPSLRLLARALVRTLIVPWGSGALGWVAVGLAVLGALRLARHNRRALG
jgi:hypothetical protein